MTASQTELRQILGEAGLASGTLDRTLKLLEARRKDGPRLTIDLPHTDQATIQRWLGRRLAWWPRGIPPGRRIGLVSSRLGRQLETKVAWFTVLRAACAKLKRGDLLITAPRTTTDRFVDRCAELFQRRLIRINISADEVPLARWLQQVLARRLDERATVYELFLSPPLGSPDGQGVAPSGLETPARDRALVALADQLIALHVRRGGHLHRLLQARLGGAAWPPASVYCALGPDLVEGDLAGQLMDQGAVGWVVLGALPRGPGSAQPRNEQASPQAAGCGAVGRPTGHWAPIIPLPPAAGWSFLTHCTRRRAGPWPDQAEQEYLDDLILSRPSADHGALAALQRIVDERRLRASAEAIRGATPVVSFTAVPLPELPQLRVFRPHRGRWDFQPYGICIRRQRLEQLGARPVRYGDQSCWQSLPVEEKPFFQLRQTSGRGGKRTIDWSVEKEWRHPGDVDLSRLAADDALLFVPSESEADNLAQTSPWPITILSA